MTKLSLTFEGIYTSIFQAWFVSIKTGVVFVAFWRLINVQLFSLFIAFDTDDQRILLPTLVQCKISTTATIIIIKLLFLNWPLNECGKWFIKIFLSFYASSVIINTFYGVGLLMIRLCYLVPKVVLKITSGYRPTMVKPHGLMLLPILEHDVVVALQTLLGPTAAVVLVICNDDIHTNFVLTFLKLLCRHKISLFNYTTLA